MQYESVISASYQRSIVRRRISPVLKSLNIMTILSLAWDDLTYTATGIFDIALSTRN